MESDDPEVAAMHLAYATTFDPSVYLRASTRRLLPQPLMMPLSRPPLGGHVDWWRWEHNMDLDVPSWRLWVNRCLAGRCHSRTAAFLASGSVFALHKDDPAAREEREKSGKPLRVRPLGVGYVLVRLVSAHALGQVGADAREVMGPLLVACAVRQTGFLSRMMPPSELDPFLEAVVAANISAAFSLLGVDACDQSTPRMEAAIVQMSMPADFGGLNLALLQSEAPAAFYSAQSVLLPKVVHTGVRARPWPLIRGGPRRGVVCGYECFAMGT
eukprot:jgi/Tetstr1/432395/TSEL_021792.t1